MKSYDLIVIGTGSAMNIVEPFLQREPEKKVAVIAKDEPGGICLTRGCIPTKIPMHIHPSLSGVVERAFFSLMTVSDYDYMMRERP